MHQSVKNNVIDQLEMIEKKTKPLTNIYIYFVSYKFYNFFSKNSTILPLNVTATLSMKTAVLELHNSTSTIKGIQMIYVSLKNIFPKSSIKYTWSKEF